ncbi:phage major capsid protein [uncultured Roseibium sp.]|uniref:phage major capsid protein n=1 Tax=uncultured Roseibium sp. TaxID=1936171 RepID=UPI002622C185|nr:phage major capsid protein [uncultured Roseibium sp.]
MDPQVKELREQQARILTNARAKFDEIKDDTPEDRASEIEREFDAMMADHDKLGQRAERLERMDTAKRALDAGDHRRPLGNDGERRGAGAEGDLTYRSAFHQYLQAEGNVALMDADAREILRAGFSKVDGAEKRAQTTSNTAGGYTVPVELQNILIKSMAMWGPMYDENVATEIVTTGGYEIDIPTVNDTAVTAGASGGEGVTLTDDGGKDVTFSQKVLNAYAFDTEWVRVSKELADDSIFAMETLLGELLGERLGRLANTQLTTGSGSSAPNGIVTASAQGKVAASTSAITWDEVIDLEHSVDPAYRAGPKVRYMFHDTTLQALRKLKDGDGNYLWQMGDVQRGIPATFNGRAYSINQAMAELDSGVSSKVMLFGDFGKYYVRKVGSVLIGAIQDKDFWPGFGVAGYARFDGELGDTAAVKHLALAAS